MSSVDRDDLLTAAELAERIGVKPATILGWHRDGRIPARKLSNKILRFDLTAVLAALEGHYEARQDDGGRAVAP